MIRLQHMAWIPCLVVFLLSTADCCAQPRIQLTDVTSKTGVTFRHTDGGSGRHYIVEYVSAGLALFDFDGDGDIDIYFLNGAPMPGTKFHERPTNKLYRNDGDWKFTDVTMSAGVADTGHGLGVTVGDYDNDGNVDLYLNNFGPNVLYRNNGDGTFQDVSRRAGVENANRVGAGTCFLDIDRDGDLDLYVANYVKFSFDKHIPRTQQGFSIYGTPLDYPADPDVLFRNNGDGTFSDISVEAGIAQHVGYGMGTVCVDYDRDGDTDILVGNDTGANFLFQNDGNGKFKEVGLICGFAYDRTGTIQGTMGLDCGDFDNDGQFDFHATSYQNEHATLYKGIGRRFLEDVSNTTGAGLGTNQPVTWGNGFVDFDNDGFRDIFVACGHLYDNVDRFDDRSTYKARNMLFRNLGNHKFVDVSQQSGNGMSVKLSSRGAGFDDLDNDGDMDGVILNSRYEPTLLRNDSDNQHHWISLQLRGVTMNRDAVGAQVEVISGGLKQIDEVHSGRGYQGHHGTRLHFGLGKRNRVDQVKVRWLGGGVDVLKDLKIDRFHTIRQPVSKQAATETSK